MTNHETAILEYLAKHQSLKVAEICRLTKLGEHTVKRAIQPLFKQGILARASNWSYSLNDEPKQEESEAYLRKAKLATELESKRFWLRASQVWLEAMILARYEETRQEVKDHRDHCSRMGSFCCGSYSGINSGTVRDSNLGDVFP